MLDSRQTHSGMTGANSQGTLSKFARRAWVAILGQAPRSILRDKALTIKLLLMVSQKVRPTALQRFFKISTYHMYAFVLEKPLRLVGRNFCLAISS
ncbi:MAG: hypothetical protein U9R69_07815, partial [Thermodesulfobacteriota bacterium]|nr:hypothetical protein [Thermodesulfobacteriota bacterium]